MSMPGEAAPMEIQLILADAAQAVNGKVSMLGAGWSVTGTPTAPSAVVALIKVPWDRANEHLQLHLELVDEDGQPVLIPGPSGAAPVEFRGDLEAGRPAGLKPGTPIDASFVVSIPPLPLGSGRYVWSLELGGETVTTSFQVAESAQPST
jgi:hypothetical protein